MYQDETLKPSTGTPAHPAAPQAAAADPKRTQKPTHSKFRDFDDETKTFSHLDADGVPLPLDCTRRTDGNRFYYQNHTTSTTSWQRPPYANFDTSWHSWQYCTTHVQVEVLHSESKRDQWNTICKTLKNRKNAIFGNWSRGGTSANGLLYAEVDGTRINPEVAYITRAPLLLSQLYTMTAEELNAVLVGFVPYSVVKGDSGRVLILPMGLQKMPNGFGSFGEWDAERVVDLERADLGDAVTIKRELPGAVKNVLGMLAKRMLEQHPESVVLTRFASRNLKPETAWTNAGLRSWEKQFSPGHFRLGWLVYRREGTILVRTKPGTRSERKTVIHNCGPEVFGPEELKPTTYDPKGGGAAIEDDTLTVTDAEGKIILQLGVPVKGPLKNLLGPEFHTVLGSLMCAWT